MTKNLDTKIQQLHTVVIAQKSLEAKEKELRDDIAEILTREDMDQYKNEVATIAMAERKTIIFTKPKEEILEEFKKQNLSAYYETKTDFSKKFNDGLKDGSIKVDGAEVESKVSPQIRFAEIK